MAHPANLRQTLRALAVPMFLSLAVHALLLLALWFCPMPSRSPALAIESTRIALETCLLDSDSSANHPDADLPPYLRGPDVHIEPNFHPTLVAAPAPPPETTAAAEPILSPEKASGPPSVSLSPPTGSNPSGSGHGVTGSLLSLPPTAASVVYVLDRSVSMGEYNKLDLACRELLASLRRLPPAARFQVIAYNSCAEPLVIDGRIGLLPAEPAIIDKVARALEKLPATGGTDHARALRRGLALRPDVLFFVTDAADLPFEQVESVTRCNQGTAIHAIELTRRRNPQPDSPLAQLARGNGGTYRRVPVSALE